MMSVCAAVKPTDTADTEMVVENSDVKFRVTKLFTKVSAS